MKYKYLKYLKNGGKGYVALMTVIVLGVVATVVATSLVILGLGHSRSALSENQTAQAKVAADACSEEALKQISLSSSYTGTGNLTLSTGVGCSYTVTNTGGPSRQITSSGTSGPNIRKETITITAVTPNIVFSSWQETQ